MNSPWSGNSCNRPWKGSVLIVNHTFETSNESITKQPNCRRPQFSCSKALIANGTMRGYRLRKKRDWLFKLSSKPTNAQAVIAGPACCICSQIDFQNSAAKMKHGP